ncbi:MAG: MogA/MoaB family molybdenum cofactor biosynthesis protein [Chloroflexota bacterium]
MTSKTALVLTVSDRVSAGTRADTSGDLLGERLAEMGYAVERRLVPDEIPAIATAIREAAAAHPLIVSTGGTGLTPRDVTPQATRTVLDYEVPGIAEAMRAAGRTKTPLADLSRGLVGVVGRSLVINVPGSPKGSMESFDAVVPILDHALETLSGPFDHDTARAEGRRDLPPGA